MFDLGKNSIRRGLVLRFMLITGLALTFASLALLGTQYSSARTRMVEHLIVVARMVGENTGASLVFADRTDAEETLRALQAQQHVTSADLYDEVGDVFASYRQDATEVQAAPAEIAIGHEFNEDRLELFEPVLMNGERIGTVYIRADTSQLDTLVSRFVGVFVVVMGASLLLCFIGASMVLRRISLPLGALMDGSSRMASGDLSVEVEVFGGDELGTLAQSFNGMVVSLRDLVAQVGQNTTAVATVSHTLHEASDSLSVEAGRQEMAVSDTSESIQRINQSIRDVNNGVQTLSHTATETSTAAMQMDTSIGEIAGHMDSLSETIDDTASSVVEMTGAIREIARNADQLNESTDSTVSALGLLSQAVKQVESNAQQTHQLSEETAKQAEQGRHSVQETVDGMLEIQVSFTGIERIISDLSVKSESIGEVVKVIESVVEQTNLLALNAAIISSQAGEHGRAFSVVADEVRSLAERTAGSTREISDLIQSVQQGIDDAVGAMEQGSERVSNGVTLSREAGEILRLIGNSAQQSTERIHEIVGATERQALDIDKVDAAISQVKTIAAQVNRGTHEQDYASAEIKRSVERMRELGQRVKRSTQEQRRESSLITESVEVVAARINQILESTKDQSKQGEQILVALEVFRDVTLQSKERSDEMRRSLGELSERSGALEREIGRFRL